MKFLPLFIVSLIVVGAIYTFADMAHVQPLMWWTSQPILVVAGVAAAGLFAFVCKK